MIITIEGTDGAGKATQTKLLYEYLTSLGKKVKTLSFPNYGSRGCEPVKMYLSGELGGIEKLNAVQVNSLFAVDRLTTIAREDFSRYDFVLLDRYTTSSMIHQSALTQTEAELNSFLDYVADFEFNQLKLPKPDVVIFLDVPVEISFKLAQNRAELKDKSSSGQDIYESNFAHLKTAYNRAKYIAKKFNWISINCAQNGNIKPINQIHEQILNCLQEIGVLNLNTNLKG